VCFPANAIPHKHFVVFNDIGEKHQSDEPKGTAVTNDENCFYGVFVQLSSGFNVFNSPL
jgi:hypothetical protein